MGAWIEIRLNTSLSATAGSLPSWERGLKYCDLFPDEVVGLSLPSWERGLKYRIRCKRTLRIPVAPLVGAWIEISGLGANTYHLQRRSPRGSVD